MLKVFKRFYGDKKRKGILRGHVLTIPLLPILPLQCLLLPIPLLHLSFLSPPTGCECIVYAAKNVLNILLRHLSRITQEKIRLQTFPMSFLSQFSPLWKRRAWPCLESSMPSTNSENCVQPLFCHEYPRRLLPSSGIRH